MPTQPSHDERPLHEKAASVVRKLREAGHEAYFAGGCVRDMLMGREPKDWDVTTSASADDVMALFRRTIAIGAQFGVVQVRYGGAQFEVATFRTEHGYSDGRRPDRVERATAREDVLRRDFTINGLLYDPEQERVLDWVSGQDDIRNEVVRAIGDPEARFGEDHLRMLRAVRFAARFGFRIDDATFEAIRRHAGAVVTVSAERVREELARTLAEGGAARGMELLGGSGLMDVVLPELTPIREDGRFAHCIRMLEAMAPGDFVLGLAILLHEVSGERVEALGRRLRLSNQETARLVALVEGRRQSDRAPSLDQADLRRFLRQPHFASIMELLRLDAHAGHGDPDTWRACVQERDRLPQDALFPPRLLDGNDLKRLGYAPGPRFKAALDALEDAQLREEVSTRDEAVALVRTLLDAPA